MQGSSASPARLVIVEADAALRDFLATLLQDAGYSVHGAASPGEARALLAAQPAQLLLVDLGPPQAGDPFAVARAVQALAPERPVGLLTDRTISEDDARGQGFAFLVALPFDIDNLLLPIAATLTPPARSLAQQQEAVVQRYFAALTARDWDALVALCSETVLYVLPHPAPFAAIVQGKGALRAYTEETYRHFPQATFRQVQTLALPRGLVARYEAAWRTPEGAEGQQSGAVVFTFVGEQIAQIGIQLDAERLRALLAERSD